MPFPPFDFSALRGDCLCTSCDVITLPPEDIFARQPIKWEYEHGQTNAIDMIE